MKCRRFSLKIHTALNRPVGTKWNHFPFPRDPRLVCVHVFVMVSIFSFLVFIYIYFASIFAFREFFDTIGEWRMIYIYYNGSGWFRLIIFIPWEELFFTWLNYYLYIFYSYLCLRIFLFIVSYICTNIYIYSNISFLYYFLYISLNYFTNLLLLFFLIYGI